MLRSAGANLIGCIVNTIGSGTEFERVGYYGYYGDAAKDPATNQNGSSESNGTLLSKARRS